MNDLSKSTTALDDDKLVNPETGEPAPAAPEKPSTPQLPEDTPINKDNYITETLGKPADPTKNENINTGSGAQAANGTSYSWDNKAAERAQLTYKSDVLTAKQDALAKRQEIETQAQQYQLQSDMKKYADNQSAEKAGWAGGYVLDQQRQREYLQQSINASMYNSMELQKYGYKSQLQAARLAYDSNMYDLALEYYQQAVHNSINEAAQTGLYMSAEAKDMLAQWSTAQAKLKENPEDEQALKLSETINSWFAEQNISPAGVKTLGMISAEIEKLNMRTAIMEAARNNIPESERAYTFVVGVDEDGQAILMNFNTSSPQAILDYINQEGSKGEAAKANLNSYFKYMTETIINDYANSTDSYNDADFKKYAEERKSLQKFIEMFESEEGNSMLQYITDLTKYTDVPFTNSKTNKTTRFTLVMGDDGKFIWKTEDQPEGGGASGDTSSSTSVVNITFDQNVATNSKNVNYNHILEGKQEDFVCRYNGNYYAVKTSGKLIKQEDESGLYTTLNDAAGGSATQGKMVYHNGSLYLCVNSSAWTEVNGRASNYAWDENYAWKNSGAADLIAAIEKKNSELYANGVTKGTFNNGEFTNGLLDAAVTKKDQFDSAASAAWLLGGPVGLLIQAAINDTSAQTVTIDGANYKVKSREKQSNTDDINKLYQQYGGKTPQKQSCFAHDGAFYCYDGNSWYKLTIN